MSNNTNNLGGLPKIEGLGLAGFILGIVGLVPVYGIIMAILAIIFGGISLRSFISKPGKYKGMGFAVSALVTGILGTLISLFFLIANFNPYHSLMS
jgi:hypothetical protein